MGTVVGTIVNPAGLTLAKTVPIERATAFIDPGLGASPTWHGFAIDQSGIAFTDAISVVGDQRIRIDPEGLRSIGDGMAWAPGLFFDQDGTPVPECARGTLARLEHGLADAGCRPGSATRSSSCSSARTAAGCPVTCGRSTGWPVCSSTRAFIRDVIAAAATAGVEIEQFHPEYGVNQFEISLPPHPRSPRPISLS